MQLPQAEHRSELLKMENIEEEVASVVTEAASEEIEAIEEMKVAILDHIAHLDSLIATTLKEVVGKDVVAQDKQEVLLPNDSSK